MKVDKTVWRCLTLYKIMAKHFQHFKTTQGYLSASKKKVAFCLETKRFLPITGDKSPKSDWNWRVWLQTRVWAILSTLTQMSRAKRDVSTWQMLLESTEPLSWRCNHLSQQWKPNRSKISTREWHAKGDARARCGERTWELFVSYVPHGFADHSRVRLPLEMERLLPVHNISW